MTTFAPDREREPQFPLLPVRAAPGRAIRRTASPRSSTALAASPRRCRSADRRGQGRRLPPVARPRVSPPRSSSCWSGHPVSPPSRLPPRSSRARNRPAPHGHPRSSHRDLVREPDHPAHDVTHSTKNAPASAVTGSALRRLSPSSEGDQVGHDQPQERDVADGATTTAGDHRHEHEPGVDHAVVAHAEVDREARPSRRR